MIYSNALYKQVIYGQRPDQTTTPGTTCSTTLYDECVGPLTSPASHYSEYTGDGAYGLSSFSEKTRISNHLQISLQRQHILLRYFKTLSVGPVWGSNPRPPSRKSDVLPTELTGRRKCRQGDETVFWGNSVSFCISWGSRYESLLASSFSSSNQ